MKNCPPYLGSYKELSIRRGRQAGPLPSPRWYRSRQQNSLLFDVRAALFALLGKAFGTFLANPWVIVPLAVFFVLMGLSMFGAFELALPGGLQNRLSRVGGKGFGGDFSSLVERRINGGLLFRSDADSREDRG